MAALGGSDLPVSLDPFRTIVDVGWGGIIAIIIVEHNVDSNWGLAIVVDGERIPPRDLAAEAAANAKLADAKRNASEMRGKADSAAQAAAEAESNFTRLAFELSQIGQAAGVRAPPGPLIYDDDATQEERDEALAEWETKNEEADAAYAQLLQEVDAAKQASTAAHKSASDAKKTAEDADKAARDAEKKVREAENAATDAITKIPLATSGATPGPLTKEALDGQLVLTQGGGSGEEDWRGFWIVNLEKLRESHPEMVEVTYQLYKHVEKRIDLPHAPEQIEKTRTYGHVGAVWWTPAPGDPGKFVTLKPPAWSDWLPDGYYYADPQRHENKTQSVTISGPPWPLSSIGGGTEPLHKVRLSDLLSVGASASYQEPYPDPKFDIWAHMTSTYAPKPGDPPSRDKEASVLDLVVCGDDGVISVTGSEEFGYRAESDAEDVHISSPPVRFDASAGGLVREWTHSANF